VNQHVTTPIFEAQVTRAARRLTGLSVPTVPKGVVGVYDVADDWTPIYDRTELDGFYVAIGTSGNQFKNAPLAGVHQYVTRAATSRSRIRSSQTGPSR
jgi:glycine/D-amino acid oxidase-like deaminating enzyme